MECVCLLTLFPRAACCPPHSRAWTAGCPGDKAPAGWSSPWYFALDFLRATHHIVLVQSDATCVTDYLASLPDDRRTAIEAVRKTILKNLGKGYEEGMQYKMIGYYVPHSVYPPGYHCNPKEPLPFASLASQKNHMAIYLMCLYTDPDHLDWFTTAWKKTGKRLDMGKSCVRFKKPEDVPLDVVGQAIKRVPVKKYLKFYESALKK